MLEAMLHECERIGIKATKDPRINFLGVDFSLLITLGYFFYFLPVSLKIIRYKRDKKTLNPFLLSMIIASEKRRQVASQSYDLVFVDQGLTNILRKFFDKSVEPCLEMLPLPQAIVHVWAPRWLREMRIALRDKGHSKITGSRRLKVASLLACNWAAKMEINEVKNILIAWNKKRCSPELPRLLIDEVLANVTRGHVLINIDLCAGLVNSVGHGWRNL
ncbi:hypothetical protein [Halomonas sp. BC04]|uniref:hypothetical protein n=1 Tax=Halomonas sp. BC04 TaxID=1403540 RepID=UPI0012DDD71A|nr:hypothetical protein [Halomonas sp. BC04]